MPKKIKINNFNSQAEYYDLLENKHQIFFDDLINYLEKKFKQNKAQRVLDVTCGTGAQSIPLAKKGFRVVGADIAKNLLKIARQKSQNLSNIKFLVGDVKFIKLGKFDAIISCLNSLGYLNKKDFKKALVNINSHLDINGLFIFDNTNKTFLDNNKLTNSKVIDVAGESNNMKFVRFTNSGYNKRSGIIRTVWSVLIQKDFKKPITFNGIWSRQTYSIKDLTKLLQDAGFKVEIVLDRSLSKFNARKSFSYMVVARKFINL